MQYQLSVQLSAYSLSKNVSSTGNNIAQRSVATGFFRVETDSSFDPVTALRMFLLPQRKFPAAIVG